MERRCTISLFPRKGNEGCGRKKDSRQSASCKISSTNVRFRTPVRPATRFYRFIPFRIIQRGLSESTTIRKRADSKGGVVRCPGGPTGIRRFTASRPDTIQRTTSPVFHSRAKQSTPPSEREPKREIFLSLLTAARALGELAAYVLWTDESGFSSRQEQSAPVWFVPN